MAAVLVGDLGEIYKDCFAHCLEAAYEILIEIGPVVSEKSFEGIDGRQALFSYKLPWSPWFRGAKTFLSQDLNSQPSG